MSQMPATLESVHASRSFWGDVLRYIRRDFITMFALILLFGLTLLCFILPPVLEQARGLDANRTQMSQRFNPPDDINWLGTDNLGRDQLLRLLYGGRISLIIAYTASLASIIIGVTLGMIAGYFGGLIDDAIIWLINTMQAIPVIFLVLVIFSLWQPSVEGLVVVMAAISWISSCRIVRAEVLALRSRDYIVAAQALGGSGLRVMTAHMLPNVMPLIIVSLTITAGTLILVESALSYLGVGVQPPTPSWGNMLTEARAFFARGMHLIVWPGVLITLTVLCFYLIGDGLRDALDPRMNRE